MTVDPTATRSEDQISDRGDAWALTIEAWISGSTMESGDPMSIDSGDLLRAAVGTKISAEKSKNRGGVSAELKRSRRSEDLKFPFIHHQVLKIREEESHVGVDMGEALSAKKEKQAVFHPNALLCSRPVLPSSPLGNKTAIENFSFSIFLLSVFFLSYSVLRTVVRFAVRKFLLRVKKTDMSFPRNKRGMELKNNTKKLLVVVLAEIRVAIGALPACRPRPHPPIQKLKTQPPRFVYSVVIILHVAIPKSGLSLHSKCLGLFAKHSPELSHLYSPDNFKRAAAQLSYMSKIAGASSLS
ncbi:hypothetical protein ACLOJK_013050 [Asimina triloba]